MTCVVGLVYDNAVYIGADSAATDSNTDTLILKNKKVFSNGKFIFGFTSSYRMGQLLEYSFVPPVHDTCISVDKYIRTSFLNSVRKCFDEGGYLHKENNVESCGTFMVGYKGSLFVVDGDFNVRETLIGFDAIGCGSEVARGVMYASMDGGDATFPVVRIRQALEAAEYFNSSVKNPFYCIKLINGESTVQLI